MFSDMVDGHVIDVEIPWGNGSEYKDEQVVDREWPIVSRIDYSSLL